MVQASAYAMTDYYANEKVLFFDRRQNTFEELIAVGLVPAPNHHDVMFWVYPDGIGTGTQGSLVTFACGSGSVQFSATADTTYYVLAVDEQLDGVNGGTLRISFSEPRPPTVDIAVDPVATFNAHTGVATITGIRVALRPARRWHLPHDRSRQDLEAGT